MSTFGLRSTAGFSGCPRQHWFGLDISDPADSGKEPTSAGDRMGLGTSTRFVSRLTAIAIAAAARHGKPLAPQNKQSRRISETSGEKS